jgi:hypothetical protein
VKREAMINTARPEAESERLRKGGGGGEKASVASDCELAPTPSPMRLARTDGGVDVQPWVGRKSRKLRRACGLSTRIPWPPNSFTGSPSSRKSTALTVSNCVRV